MRTIYHQSSLQSVVIAASHLLADCCVLVQIPIRCPNIGQVRIMSQHCSTAVEPSHTNPLSTTEQIQLLGHCFSRKGIQKNNVLTHLTRVPSSHYYPKYLKLQNHRETRKNTYIPWYSFLQNSAPLTFVYFFRREI